MESWGVFFIFIFWIILFLFLQKGSNFINVLIYSESIWVILYALSLVLGSQTDDLNLISLTFLSLGLAGLEFSLGLLLIVAYKNNLGTLYIS